MWEYDGRFDIRVEWDDNVHREAYGVPLCSARAIVVDPSGHIDAR